MGNTSSMYKNISGDTLRKITVEEIEKTLNEINNDLFDNKLPITFIDGDVMFINEESDLYWWLETTPMFRYYYDDTDKETEKEVADNFIEYRDVPRLNTSAWLQDILTKEFSKRLGLINYCPAIDSDMSQPYAKTFEEYTKSMHSSFSKFVEFVMTPWLKRLYQEDLKLAKHYYPTELYDYLFDKNFKLK